MKSLVEYINEQDDMKMSSDDIANRIITYMMDNYPHIHWKTKSVESSIKDVSHKSYLSMNFKKLPSDVINSDHLYCMSCWNGGESLNKNAKFSQADIVSSDNNTDNKWFLDVKESGKNKYNVDVYFYKFRYYGLPCICKKIVSFTI